jgi:hypothetical protein
MYAAPYRTSVARYQIADQDHVLGAPDYLRFALVEKRTRLETAMDLKKTGADAKRRLGLFRDALREQAVKLPKSAANEMAALAGEFVSLEGPADAAELESLSEVQQAEFKKESEVLGRKLDQNPRDYGTWKALLSLQDRLMASDVSRTAALRTAIAEKKISMCEKALESIPDCDSLWLDYLQIGALVWDTPALLTKWDRALKAVPDSGIIWMGYLAFRQTNAATFTCSECLDVFGTFLQKRLPKDSAQARKLERAKVYGFFRACHMLRESGYIERAVAAIQSLLEITFRWPPQLSRNRWEEAMVAFEDYYDSSAQKFGLEGSQGWAAFFSRDKEADEDDVAPPDAEREDSETEQQWWDEERDSDEKNWMPQRAESALQDPNAVVVLEDIRSLLFPVDSTELQTEIVSECLRFFGIPVCFEMSSSGDMCYDDAFLTNAMGDRCLEADDSGGRPFDPRIVASYPQTVDYLFTRDRLFGVLREDFFLCRMLRSSGAVDFVRQLLLQALAATKGYLATQISAVLLAMEFCASQKRWVNWLFADVVRAPDE